MFKILSYLYYDPFSKCYRKILTLSSDPKDDNISNIIKKIPRKKGHLLIIPVIAN